VTPRRVKGLVGLIDLAPTLWDLAGVNEVRSIIRGRSLAPFIVSGNRVPPMDYLVEQTRYTQEFSLVTDKYHMRFDQSNNIIELFDRAKDPLEKHDISTLKPELTLKLRRRLVKKMTPILLTMTDRVKRVLLTGIPDNFHKVSAGFVGGPRVKALLVRQMKGAVETDV
jgi:arylsulfatase A-like enzyme